SSLMSVEPSAVCCTCTLFPGSSVYLGSRCWSKRRAVSLLTVTALADVTFELSSLFEDTPPRSLLTTIVVLIDRRRGHLRLHSLLHEIDPSRGRLTERIALCLCTSFLGLFHLRPTITIFVSDKAHHRSHILFLRKSHQSHRFNPFALTYRIYLSQSPG